MPSSSKRPPAAALPLYHAPALEKGLDILEHLAGATAPLSQAELAAALKRAPSEIYRMLMCLEHRGYVMRESESGRVRLTLRIYELGHRISALERLREAARLPMESLADATGQSCHLSVQHGHQLIVLRERMPSKRICLAVGEGTVLPLLSTTSGRVILSRLSGRAASEILQADKGFSRMSASKRQEVEHEIARARKLGYLVLPSSMTEGVSDIAVAVGVSGTDTAAVLALSQVVPQKPFAPHANLAASRRAAIQINRHLGISPQFLSAKIQVKV